MNGHATILWLTGSPSCALLEIRHPWLWIQPNGERITETSLVNAVASVAFGQVSAAPIDAKGRQYSPQIRSEPPLLFADHCVAKLPYRQQLLSEWSGYVGLLGALRLSVADLCDTQTENKVSKWVCFSSKDRFLVPTSLVAETLLNYERRRRLLCHDAVQRVDDHERIFFEEDGRQTSVADFFESCQRAWRGSS
jgi:hypothetical protein